MQYFVFLSYLSQNVNKQGFNPSIESAQPFVQQGHGASTKRTQLFFYGPIFLMSPFFREHCFQNLQKRSVRSPELIGI
jgi:hypothetical protein